MPPSIRDPLYEARTTSVLKPSNLELVLSHRQRADQEEYLVRWKLNDGQPKANAVCSWHGLKDLWRSLHLVQKYVEGLQKHKKIATHAENALNRKRKSPGADVSLPRDRESGILTPQASTHLSRSASVVSISSDEDDGDNEEISVYNAVLERKEGWIVAKESSRAKKIDATTLPTASMVNKAARTSMQQAERAIRDAFYTKLQKLPKLYLENNIDTSTPSLDFRFIRKYVLGDDVYAADPETFEGCQRPCRPDMGQGIGCEYTSCTCLEYAAVDEKALERQDPARYQHYMKQKQAGEYIELAGLPKRFPYHKKRAGDARYPQTLQYFYRDQRHPIYECNINCKCGPVCKSRVVQKGRRVPLTIFKTRARGWGVKCNEDLIAGEFIDTYLGEVITYAEADRREEASGSHDKDSYLYNLDKFVGDSADLTLESSYIVDGQYMGGPTRFINHSCEPNCRQFTVSYNKHDFRLYDLAFFAMEDIPRGTELTFDYMDQNEVEEEDADRMRAEAEANPENAGKPRCQCGARKCRGFLWS